MNQHDFSYLKMSLLLNFGKVEAEILRLEQKAETKQDIFKWPPLIVLIENFAVDTRGNKLKD